MIRRLLNALRLRFGLRAQTCARRNRRPAAFKVVRGEDGFDYIAPRTAR